MTDRVEGDGMNHKPGKANGADRGTVGERPAVGAPGDGARRAVLEYADALRELAAGPELVAGPYDYDDHMEA